MSLSPKTRVAKRKRARQTLTAIQRPTRVTVLEKVAGSLVAKLRNKSYRQAYVKSHLLQGISHQIRTIRECRNLTQNELAKQVGTTQTIVCRLEDPSYGRFTLTTLTKYAEALDVALLVKFVSFPKFLAETADKSPEGLYAESFEESEENAFSGAYYPQKGHDLVYISNINAYVPAESSWTVIDLPPTRTSVTPDYSFSDINAKFMPNEFIKLKAGSHE